MVSSGQSVDVGSGLLPAYPAAAFALTRPQDGTPPRWVYPARTACAAAARPGRGLDRTGTAVVVSCCAGAMVHSAGWIARTRGDESHTCQRETLVALPT